ncbi:MAG: Cyclic AMP receptor protein [Acidobacteria bacterium]|nr:Cyclic AMP receptor protein [Acidobacteriota bacterium]
MPTTPIPPIFREQWPEFVPVATRRVFKRRAVIFHQGDEPEAIYFISRGDVKLPRVEVGGREVILGLRRPGNLLGVATAIAEKPYEMSAVASSECVIERIPLGVFTEMSRNDAQLCWRVMQIACRNNLEIAAHLTRINELSAREHLEYVLGQFLSEQHGDAAPSSGVRLSLPVSDREVAQMISIAPQYLCEILAELMGEGVVRREGRKRLEVVAPRHLWRFTEPLLHDRAH